MPVTEIDSLLSSSSKREKLRSMYMTELRTDAVWLLLLLCPSENPLSVTISKMKQ